MSVIVTASTSIIVKFLIVFDIIGITASVMYDAGFWDDMHKTSGTIVNFATFASVLVSLYLKLKNKSNPPSSGGQKQN